MYLCVLLTTSLRKYAHHEDDQKGQSVVIYLSSYDLLCASHSNGPLQKTSSSEGFSIPCLNINNQLPYYPSIRKQPKEHATDFALRCDLNPLKLNNLVFIAFELPDLAEDSGSESRFTSAGARAPLIGDMWMQCRQPKFCKPHRLFAWVPLPSNFEHVPISRGCVESEAPSSTDSNNNSCVLVSASVVYLQWNMSEKVMRWSMIRRQRGRIRAACWKFIVTSPVQDRHLIRVPNASTASIDSCSSASTPQVVSTRETATMACK